MSGQDHVSIRIGSPTHGSSQISQMPQEQPEGSSKHCSELYERRSSSSRSLDPSDEQSSTPTYEFVVKESPQDHHGLHICKDFDETSRKATCSSISTHHTSIVEMLPTVPVATESQYCNQPRWNYHNEFPFTSHSTPKCSGSDPMGKIDRTSSHALQLKSPSQSSWFDLPPGTLAVAQNSSTYKDLTSAGSPTWVDFSAKIPVQSRSQLDIPPNSSEMKSAKDELLGRKEDNHEKDQEASWFHFVFGYEKNDSKDEDDDPAGVEVDRSDRNFNYSHSSMMVEASTTPSKSNSKYQPPTARQSSSPDPLAAPYIFTRPAPMSGRIGVGPSAKRGRQLVVQPTMT